MSVYVSVCVSVCVYVSVCECVCECVCRLLCITCCVRHFEDCECVLCVGVYVSDGLKSSHTERTFFCTHGKYI